MRPPAARKAEASSRSIVREVEPPEQRAALLDVAVDRIRARAQPRAEVAVLELQVGGVDRLPHLGRDDVAHGARALPGAPEARAPPSVGLSASTVSARSTSSRRRGAVAAAGAPMIASTASQSSGHAGGVVGRPCSVGLEDAVEHARGVLGAREVAAEPEQLVGDPGQHSYCCCVGAAVAGRPGRTAVAQVGQRGRLAVSMPSGSARSVSWPSSSTQVSFEPPPREELTIIEPSISATRVRPPGTILIVLAEDGERAQVDVARREAPVVAGRGHGRQLDDLLGDPALGVRGGSRRPAPPARRRGGRRADEDALAARLARRLDDELVEAAEHVLALLGVGEQVGLDVGRGSAPRRGRSGSSPARSGRPPCRRPRRCRTRWRSRRCPAR